MDKRNKDDEVKNLILEAARRVFRKWGLKKSTMEDIAHEAGKGKSTLYYYYKSKEEIFEILAKTELYNIIEKAKDATQHISSAKEKLKTYITTMLIEIKKTISIYPLVKGEIKGNKEFLDNVIKQLNEKEEAIILEILKEGFNSGEFSFLKKSELAKAANVIVGLVSGSAVYLFFDNDDNEKIDIVTRLITGGL
ncbi:MAG: TetR/AcrR family transcriptional regulator [Ignavibacteriaceae bacterium]